jgi:hypothetical protein
MNLQAFDASPLENLQSENAAGAKGPLSINGFGVFSGRHLDRHIACIIAESPSQCRRARRLRREIHPIFRCRLPTDTAAQSRRRKLALA